MCIRDRSTTESEVVSLAAGLYGDALPMLNMWDVLLGRDCELEVFEDNNATITVVRKGYSSKLRHINRTHKVNLSSLSEMFAKPGITLQYVATKEQAADIFTKGLSPGLWDSALKMLGIITDTLTPVSALCAAPVSGAPGDRIHERGELFYTHERGVPIDEYHHGCKGAVHALSNPIPHDQSQGNLIIDLASD